MPTSPIVIMSPFIHQDIPFWFFMVCLGCFAVLGWLLLKALMDDRK